MGLFGIILSIVVAFYAWFRFANIWNLHLETLINRVNIESDFWRDFGKVIFLSSAAVSSENIPTLANDNRWQGRSKELFVAASSLAFFSILIFSVILAYFVGTIFGLGIAIFAFCAGFYFVYNKKIGWKNNTGSLGAAVLWLGIFIGTQHSFGKDLAKLTFSNEPPMWVFALATSYLKGAVFGFIVSFILRFALPKSGATSWLGFQSVFVGVMSIGMGWGIILGDMIASYAREIFESDINRRIRGWISIGTGLVFLLLTEYFQLFMQDVLGGISGSMTRYLILVSMFILYWVADLIICMTVFHFKHQLANKSSK